MREAAKKLETASTEQQRMATKLLDETTLTKEWIIWPNAESARKLVDDIVARDAKIP